MTLSTMILWRRHGELMADVLHLTDNEPAGRRDKRLVRLAEAGHLTPLSETTHQDSGRIVPADDARARPGAAVHPWTLVTP